MKTKKVTVLPYDPAWKAAFQSIKEEIEGALGDLILGIVVNALLSKAKDE